MALTRSDEAAQGSVGSRSDSKPPPNPSYANDRVHHYNQDTIVPVNVHVGLTSPPQPGSSNQRNHSGLCDLIDNILGDQKRSSNPTGVVPASPVSGTVPTKTCNTLRGVGTHFDGSHPATAGQGLDMLT
ncbi:hypothetical protein F4781DRAFT_429242 [Annulohypoxylon bovei var. microspora]|nr:hypothetical protein F4781DRAFT_429242 [Annulohypoxylon bovei var. microspora]